MRTIKQKFYVKDGGMFLTAQQALDDGFIPRGKQNKNRGTKYKHKRKIASASRKANR